ncbi:MAG: radical SAM protein, partial [Geobacter sp.]
MTDALYREKLINANRREYGRAYDLLPFADEAAVAAANHERDELLTWLGEHARFGYAGTKVDCNRLSPGCQRCGEGSWSCLFINGRCNGRCFYCPTSQEDDGPPVTNGLAFSAPEEYADYVQRFGFRGVSISGGEPLLTPQLTLAYLRAVRQRCGSDLHLWLYTNGTLLTKGLCQELREAGLDEIRFDLGAVRYHLKKLRLAVGVIPTVTVEIPAVPEDELLMQRTMRELADAGCNHLNLHQLRLTPHNLPHLLERNYTFVHGEKVTVLESELT